MSRKKPSLRANTALSTPEEAHLLNIFFELNFLPV
jgi:hypothetical protein